MSDEASIRINGTHSIDEIVRAAGPEEKWHLFYDHLHAILERGDHLDWIRELSRLAAVHHLDLALLRQLVNGLSWQARRSGHPYPCDRPAAPAGDWPRGDVAELVFAYACCARPRYDFRFAELYAWTTYWLNQHPNDAMLLALKAMAACGLRSPEGPTLMQTALDSPNADQRSRYACLYAAWFGHHLPDQPNILLRLAEDLIAKGPTDGNVHYLMASALRRLGRFEEAFRSIDLAITMLGSDDTEIHQDYVRERELVAASQSLTQQTARIVNELRDEVSRQLQRGSKEFHIASGSAAGVLPQTIWTLGAPVTMLAFLAGSAVTLLQAANFSQRLTTLLVVLGASIAYGVVLRFALPTRRRPT